MSVPAEAFFVNPQDDEARAISRPDLHLVPQIDEIHEGLQAHYGKERTVTGYGAVLEKDYRGSASNKQQFGGRMLVAVSFEDSDPSQPKAEVITIDELNRELPENLVVQLGSLANINWARGKGSRRDF